MDVFEKLFQTTLHHLSGRKQLKSELQSLTPQIKSLESLSSSILLPPFQPQIVASIGAIGIQGQFLYLPSEAAVSSEKINRKIFINLALLSIAAHNLRLFQGHSDSSSIGSRIDFLKRIQDCNLYLDELFGAYRTLQKEIFASFQEPGFQLKKQRDLYEFWLSIYCSRGGVSSAIDFQFKKNEPVPNYLFLTVPSLMKLRTMPLNRIKPGGLQRELNKENKCKTEIEKPHEEVIESIELKNQELNPVTHSFEKMETADEYQGGRRIDSGDDELQNHSEALKELNLNKVTRDGESAKSIYRSESSSFEFELVDDLKLQSKLTFLYPEWSQKKSTYLREHCQVFQNPLELKAVQSDVRKELGDFYRGPIRQWRGQIQNLINRPLWINRLKDGDEIDYDSYVRDFVALNRKKDVDGKWYSRKLRRIQDFSVLILFDQSLSSDSWVKKQRVLDVILDSVGIAGILFEDVIKNVHVAGAWSSTRSRCSYQIYKGFDEPWAKYFASAKVIEPQGYTRLGPAIRHATELLGQISTRHRLLLIMTDGKPTDLDGYEGRYGIEDVKRACQEAEQREILPFALAIDSQAKHYFPKMFSHYRLLSKPELFSGEIYKILMQMMGKGSV